MQPRTWRQALAAVTLGCATLAPALAQTAADTMQQVRTQARADKRAFVEQQLRLDAPTAQKFWPVYDSYQKDLGAINQRWSVALVDYVNVSERLSDAAAAQLLQRMTTIAADRARLDQSYLKRFLKVLPGKQVARYYQLENKVRAVEEYDAAAQVPLVR